MSPKHRVRRRLPFSRPGAPTRWDIDALDPLSPPPKFVYRSSMNGYFRRQRRVEKAEEVKRRRQKVDNADVDEAKLNEFLNFDERFIPIVEQLEQMSPEDNGMVFERKLDTFEHLVYSLCPDEDTLRLAFVAIRSAALQNPMLAQKLAAVGASFTWQAHRRPLREALMNIVMWDTYEKLDLLQRVNPQYLINAAVTMGEYFTVAREPNGDRISVLAEPLLHYCNALLASHDTHAHRHFAIQIIQNGFVLNFMRPHDLDNLSILIRKRLLEVSARSAIWLLIAADMCLNKFLALPVTLQKFYTDNLQLVDIDSSPSDISKDDKEDIESENSEDHAVYEIRSESIDGSWEEIQLDEGQRETVCSLWNNNADNEFGGGECSMWREDLIKESSSGDNGNSGESDQQNNEVIFSMWNERNDDHNIHNVNEDTENADGDSDKKYSETEGFWDYDKKAHTRNNPYITNVKVDEDMNYIQDYRSWDQINLGQNNPLVNEEVGTADLDVESNRQCVEDDSWEEIDSTKEYNAPNFREEVWSNNGGDSCFSVWTETNTGKKYILAYDVVYEIILFKLNIDHNGVEWKERVNLEQYWNREVKEVLYRLSEDNDEGNKRREGEVNASQTKKEVDDDNIERMRLEIKMIARNNDVLGNANLRM